MAFEIPDDLAEKALAEKAAIMSEFGRRRAAGEPVPAELYAAHIKATNDRYVSGPDPGQRIPDFALPDQHGALRSLPDLSGPHGLLLVFYRSADWWQYCRSQLVELEQSRSMLEGNGLRIAALSYDRMEILQTFAERHGIGFPLLSDRDSVVIRSFGIFNSNIAPGLRAHGVPHPVDYLVAPDGMVIRKYFVPNYQHRVTASAVVLREFGAGAGAGASVVLRSGALTVEIGFSGATAFAGQEVGFYAKFTLEPGWHVSEVSVAFDHPGIARQSFEASSGLGSLLLKFPFEAGPVLLPGKLSVQQCSDTVCEAPETIPFTLPLTVEPFVAPASRK